MSSLSGAPAPSPAHSWPAPHPPDLVPWWTMVAPSHALRRGQILRFNLGEIPIVLFRGRDDGVVRALPAHCAHQGIDLARGTVVGDCLRCPLHHWEYSDRCEKIPGVAQVPEGLRVAKFVAAERNGMIFVHPGEPSFPIPSFFSAGDDAMHFHAGEPVELDCPWYVPVANAFDMTHLRTVHRRELTSDVEISRPDPMTFVIRYSTAITGGGWSDRITRLLARNRVESIVTCAGGTMVVIDATAGPHRSFMMISLRPTRDGGVSILPIYGVPRRRSGLHLLHARAARLLFSAFLHRDVEVLRGIRFPASYIDAQDPTINACYRFLCELPAYRSAE